MLTTVNRGYDVQYVLGLFFAGLLVVAQSCWRTAVSSHTALFSGQGLTVSKVIAFAFAPLTLLGIVLYVLATALYMYMLSRYHFSAVQGIVLAFSLILSITIAVVFFHERLTLVNIIGVALLLGGITLLNLR
ncbi:MAG TPA: hypothetical protein VLH86_01675 [Patescibacteria group bacterium]|nr:hypothetical protein [Patescibacteria group bacterium]